MDLSVSIKDDDILCLRKISQLHLLLLSFLSGKLLDDKGTSLHTLRTTNTSGLEVGRRPSSRSLKVVLWKDGQRWIGTEVLTYAPCPDRSVVF